MKRYSTWIGAVLGGATALVFVAFNYIAFQIAGLPRISFLLFDWLARNLPGGVITVAIDRMVGLISQLDLGPTSRVAKLIEQITAISLFIIAGAVLGAVLAALIARRPTKSLYYGLVGGLLFAAVVVAVLASLDSGLSVLVILWVVFLFGLWGAVLSRLILDTWGTPAVIQANHPGPLSRKEFLYIAGAGSVTILVSAAGISILSNPEGDAETAVIPDTGTLVNAGNTSGPAQSPPQSELAARQAPVPGTRPELTSNDNFYRIDINTLPPSVAEESWTLEVTGLVDRPLNLSLSELRARPATNQAITLECISNRLGGDLISTSLWTGVRLRDILDEAGMQEGAQEIYIESVDGFYESVPMADALDERTLLVYAMNGEPLPQEHGFPLRIYIPNRFGMKQPKWITRMEVIDRQGPGYWVERGWSETAVPPTTSVIDTVAADRYAPERGLLPVGGIAYAGARGISEVEVQVDDGDWQAASLIEPPLSPLTWVQWRYDWPAVQGAHTFRVRAYDGNGDLQTTEPSPPHPDGATGIYTIEETTPGS